MARVGHCTVPRIEQSEAVRNTIEEGEQGSHVHGFPNLLVAISQFAQPPGVLGRHPVSVHSERTDVCQNRPLIIRQPTAGKVAPSQGIHSFRVGPLQLQEVAMRARSVGTLVESGHERGDHFLGSP